MLQKNTPIKACAYLGSIPDVNQYMSVHEEADIIWR